jgi:uncharacterized protein YndB with AHSA1/START domain
VTIEATAEVRIARTLEAVWDELTAIERFPEWLRESGVTRVERPDGTPLGRGMPLRIEQAIAGRAAQLDGEVTAFEPGRAFGFEARHPDGIRIEAIAELEPVDPTTTWLGWRLRITLPLRLRLFEGMATPEVRRASAADLFGFKRRLEQVAG